MEKGVGAPESSQERSQPFGAGSASVLGDQQRLEGVGSDSRICRRLGCRPTGRPESGPDRGRSASQVETWGSVRRGGLRRSTSASMPLFITPGKMTPLSIRIPVAALILSIGAAGCSSHHESIRTTPEPTAAAQSQQAAIAKARADSVRHPYTAGRRPLHVGHDRPPRPGHRDGRAGRRPTAPARRCGSWPSGSSTRSRTRSPRCSMAPRPAASRCPRRTPTGMKMTMDGMEHEMLMPGMLTDEQMKQLDAGAAPSSTGCSSPS